MSKRWQTVGAGVARATLAALPAIVAWGCVMVYLDKLSTFWAVALGLLMLAGMSTIVGMRLKAARKAA
jgi:hypothetical protein